MLKIAQNPEFSHKVTVRIPVDGGHVEQSFTARFRHVPWKDLEAVYQDIDAQARLVWIGWEGIVDDDDNPIPFSDAARDRLIEMRFIALPVLRAYVDAVQGAKRGN